MKIIALLLARDESAILPTYLSSVKPVVDEIIAINDRSTDNTAQILKDAGVKVLESLEVSSRGWNEFAARQRLLELGRQNGGTHFVCLDADEALSGNFIKSGKEKILALKPGQKLFMRWPFLWKSNNYFVDDKACEFTNLYKDFIFCDRADLNFQSSFLHFGKTPGENIPQNLVKISEQDGVVLHFAYADFDNAILRQAWYRCMELIRNPKDYIKINNRYYLPKAGAGFKTLAVPNDWLVGLTLPKALEPVESSWRLKVILGWFDEYGAEFFEPLEIWNVQELRDEFVKRVGREPKASKMHIYLQPLIQLRRNLKKKLARNAE
jgi:glycosyltransferase involved in cell wall biosynthesis